jgi:hypothetical protein
MVVFLLKESRLFFISSRSVHLHSTQECPRIYMNYTSAVHTLIMHVVRWLVLIKSIILVCRSNAKYTPFSPTTWYVMLLGGFNPAINMRLLDIHFWDPSK